MNKETKMTLGEWIYERTPQIVFWCFIVLFFTFAIVVVNNYIKYGRLN